MNGVRRRWGSCGGRKSFSAKIVESLNGRGGRATLLGHCEEPSVQTHSGEKER